MDGEYRVVCSDARFRAIFGYPPAADGSALLRAWDYAGYRHVRIDVAREMGAAVVVVMDLSDVEDLMKSTH
jgi:hypothetical protein